jgi:hypothetical protein
LLYGGWASILFVSLLGGLLVQKKKGRKRQKKGIEKVKYGSVLLSKDLKVRGFSHRYWFTVVAE